MLKINDWTFSLLLGLANINSAAVNIGVYLFVLWYAQGIYPVVGLQGHQFNCSGTSNSLQPHGLQHASLPCLSLIPRACSYSCPSSW